MNMDTGLYDPGRETVGEPQNRSVRTRRPPVRRSRLVRRMLLMAAILAVLFGALYGFNRFRQQAISQFFASNRPPPVPVLAVPARSEPAPQTLIGLGSLAAVRQVVVSPEVSGRVTKILFQPGQRVKADETLVQLSDATEQADLQRFRAQARWAEASLGRAQTLSSREFGPRASVDQWQAQLDQARAEIQKVQALIAQKLVRAPFDGELGVRQVDLGQYLSAGAPIVTLTDLDTLFVNFTLPEQARSRIALEQRVRLTVDAFPDRAFEARITAIEPQVNADTRTIRLQATLPNPERRLLPGMFASARVILPSLPDVVTVPETAVDYTLYGDSVFLIREDGRDDAGNPILKATRTFVKTGDRFEGRVAILSGVNSGDLVASTGQIKLSDGAVVTMAAAEPLAQPMPLPLQ